MTRIEFLLELDLILKELSQRLSKRHAGVEGTGSVAELEFIQNELMALGDQLVSMNGLPSVREMLQSAHLVSNYWPFQDELADRINRLDFLYRNELND